MNTKKISLFFLLSSTLVYGAQKKSWLRSLRKKINPLLSEHNKRNWDNLITSVEQDPDSALPLSFNDQQTMQNFGNTPCTFADVAGGVPEEIESLLDMINNQEKYIRYGITPPKGILLVGPPGCGKTLLARAVAGESGCNFLYTSATEFIEVYVGTGPARVRELFGKAHQASLRTGKKTIIFIDEIDAVGNRTELAGHDSESKRTLNELLTQMDGFAQHTNVIVLAATNNPHDLDPALKRPGRFDSVVEIQLPDLEQRKAVLKHYCKKIPATTLKNAIPYDELASRTWDFNNAELKELVRLACLQAAKEEIALDEHHFFDSVKKIRKQKQF
jgi:ATP-dependent Zn protease